MAYETNGTGSGMGGADVSTPVGPPAQFNGVWLVGNANGHQQSIAGLALTIDRFGITVMGPEANQSHALPWTDIQHLGAGEPMAYSDGSPATVVTVTLPGHVAHFLIPPDQLAPDHVAGLSRLSGSTGVSRETSAPTTAGFGATNGNGARPIGTPVITVPAEARPVPAADFTAVPAASAIRPVAFTTASTTPVINPTANDAPATADIAGPVAEPGAPAPDTPEAKRARRNVTVITAGVGIAIVLVIVLLVALTSSSSPPSTPPSSSPSTSTPAVATGPTGPPASATLGNVATSINLTSNDLPGWDPETAVSPTSVAASSTLASCLGVPVADIGLITRQPLVDDTTSQSSGIFFGLPSGTPSTMASSVALLSSPSLVASDMTAFAKPSAAICLAVWYETFIGGSVAGTAASTPIGTAFTPTAVAGVKALGFRLQVNYQTSSGGAGSDDGGVVIFGSGRIEAALVDGGVNGPVPAAFENGIITTLQQRIATAAGAT